MEKEICQLENDSLKKIKKIKISQISHTPARAEKILINNITISHSSWGLKMKLLVICSLIANDNNCELEEPQQQLWWCDFNQVSYDSICVLWTV